MKQYILSIMKGQSTGFFADLITYLLLPWTLLYWFGLFCHRNYCHFKGVYRAPKPVISIGNITVGGSGKTPLVIWLARHLQDKGFKSVILIRGYMPKIAKASDEVDMLNEQIPYIPVIAGANREASIRETEDILPVDLYICDDAFQHWPLHRDLDMVVIDAVNPFGNGYLLPAGILREPLSALKRADIFILTKIDGSNNVQELISMLKGINPKALIMESRYASVGAVDVFNNSDNLLENSLNDKHVVGFCAIGDPASFESTLRNTGAKIVKLYTYMDHHVYTKNDIQGMVEFCRSQGSSVLVTTHKDAVKLQIFKDLMIGIRLVYLPIQLEVTKGADEFFQKIIPICRN